MSKWFWQFTFKSNWGDITVTQAPVDRHTSHFIYGWMSVGYELVKMEKVEHPVEAELVA